MARSSRSASSDMDLRPSTSSLRIRPLVATRRPKTLLNAFLISFSAYTLPSWLIYLTDNRLNATLSERLLWLQFKILYISITLTNFLHMRYSHNVGLSSKTISSKRAQIIPIIQWCLSITEYPMLSTELGTIIFFLSEWSCKVDYSILQVRILRSIVKQLLRPGITLWGLSRKYYI